MDPPPRLFGIHASEARIVAVIRRGPSDWCQVFRWDVAAQEVRAGSWFRGTIAPQKCDLSPDGRWLAYSAVKYPGRWEGGPVYDAISRLPWLTALAAWNAGSTYTRGVHFTGRNGQNALGAPDIGEYRAPWGLAITTAAQFAVERRRGWRESADSDPRDAGGHWDENRTVTMTKPHPAGSATLEVSGAYAAFRAMPSWYEGVAYRVRLEDRDLEVGDAQWADWASSGHLLVATTGGSLEARRLDRAELTTVHSHDLGPAVPDPQPPPDEAGRW